MIGINEIINNRLAKLETNSTGIIKSLGNGTCDVYLHPQPSDENGKPLPPFEVVNIPLALVSGSLVFSVKVGDPVVVLHIKFDSRKFTKEKRIGTLESTILFGKDNALAIPYFIFGGVVNSLKIEVESGFKVKNKTSDLIPNLIDSVEKLIMAIRTLTVITPQGKGTVDVFVTIAVDTVLTKLKSFNGG